MGESLGTRLCNVHAAAKQNELLEQVNRWKSSVALGLDIRLGVKEGLEERQQIEVEENAGNEIANL